MVLQRRVFAALMRSMRQFLFFSSSARQNGNSLQLARLAADRLSPAVIRQWIDLAALDLPPFRDLRPMGLPPKGDLADVFQAMMAASDICFVAPVYWYGLPAPAKLLLDHWSGWLDLPELDFAARLRGKRLWLVSARADPDPDVALPLEQALQRTVHWLGMVWGGALHGVGDAAGDVLTDRVAMAKAAQFFDL